MNELLLRRKLFKSTNFYISVGAARGSRNGSRQIFEAWAELVFLVSSLHAKQGKLPPSSFARLAGRTSSGKLNITGLDEWVYSY